MPRENSTLRIVLVGASSLRGRELNQVIEDRNFPAVEIIPLDASVPAGTLTEAGGEATFIKPMEPESIAGAHFVLFAGSAEETLANHKLAQASGATLIDLTGALTVQPGAVAWIPSLDTLVAPPASAGVKSPLIYVSPPPAVILACTIAAALRKLSPLRLSMLFFPPVSERGQAGVDELESQTAALLSLQAIAKGVFDAQVAFNLLAGYGEAAKPSLAQLRAAAARDVSSYLRDQAAAPAVQFLQAPIFYGFAFAVCAELAKQVPAGEIVSALASSGAHVVSKGEEPPSCVSVAGEEKIQMAYPEPDPSVPNAVWLWGAADNLRLAASNAVRIMEELLAPKE